MTGLPTERPPRGALVVFAALLLSAAAAGVALDRMYLVRTGRLIPAGIPGAPPLSRPSEEQLEEIFNALRKEIGLRDDQVPAVRRIIAAQIEDLERLRNSVRPRIDSIFEITRDSLDVVLDADQRARRDALLTRLAPLTDSIGLRKK